LWQHHKIQKKKKKKKKKKLGFSVQFLSVLIGGLLDQLAPGFVRIFNLSLRRIAAVVVVSLIA
jgi:hypothetical protein